MQTTTTEGRAADPIAVEMERFIGRMDAIAAARGRYEDASDQGAYTSQHALDLARTLRERDLEWRTGKVAAPRGTRSRFGLFLAGLVAGLAVAVAVLLPMQGGL